METKKKEAEFIEEVNDILSEMPHWLIQWGITGAFVIVLVILLFSYWIKYPEIIEGSVVITTQEAPVKLSANQNKPIRKIFFKNQSRVEKGDVIIEFKDATSLRKIKQLEELIIQVEKELSQLEFIATNKIGEIILGENQSTLGQLKKEIELYNNYLELNETQKNIELIEKRITFKNEYGALLNNLLVSVEERTEVEEKNYHMQEELYRLEVISKAQYLTDRITYLSKAEEIDDFKKFIVQNELSIHDDIIAIESLRTKEKQNLTSLKADITKSIFTLRNFIEHWYQSNTIVAPKDGELNYLKNFYADEYVFSGDPLFAISSDSKDLVAYSYLPLNGYGKVKEEQKARIKLNNYPYQEFGYLTGHIESISQFHNDETYLTTIKLDQGMITNMNINLRFVSETNGTVEIVTEDMRLIDRVFYQIKNLNLEI